MNRNRVRRGGAMTAVASFALVMLAACGGGAGQEEVEDVTRVPTMSDAAAQATSEAANAPATPEAAGGTPTSGTPTTGDATPATGGETSAAAMTVDIVSYDIYFEPKELTIPADTDVTFILPNDGVTAHNFAIDALGIDVDIAPGATEEVVINAPAGEYEYYCNVPGHKAAGMVGTLIVSADAAAAPDGAPDAGVEASPEVSAAATPLAAESAGTEATASPAPIAEATPADTAAEAPAAAGEAAAAVEVVSSDIYFEPEEIAIPADTDVTVTLPNDGVTLHNFSIDELGIDVDIDPGASGEVVINAPAGTYEYYCNIPGHKAAGMVGTLTVG